MWPREEQTQQQSQQSESQIGVDKFKSILEEEIISKEYSKRPATKTETSKKSQLQSRSPQEQKH